MLKTGYFVRPQFSTMALYHEEFIQRWPFNFQVLLSVLFLRTNALFRYDIWKIYADRPTEEVFSLKTYLQYS